MKLSNLLTVGLVIAATCAQAQQRQQLPAHVPTVIAQKRLQPIATLADTTNLDLVIGLPWRNEASLATLFKQLYEPTSPGFHHWLTPAEFNEQFAPSDADYQKLVTYARSNHLTIIATHPDKSLLHVRGSVSTIQNALHVKMHRFQHPTENRSFYAPDVDPSLDIDIPISHISGLDNFVIPHPVAGHQSTGAFSAKDLRTAYAPDVTLTGAGQVVGILQFAGYFPSDITAYEASAGIPNIPIQNVYLNGYKGIPETTGLPNTESSGDIEFAMAMAPGLSKVVVYGAPSDASCVELLDEMANPTHGEPLPNQLSTSYTIFFNADVYKAFQRLAAQGQTFFAASGDDGAYNEMAGAGCPPPADYPLVTCVGGTVLNTNAGAWQSETTWESSGGGISYDDPINFAIPSWQVGLDMSANGGSTTKRNCPDVAMVAQNITVIDHNGLTEGFNGTSAGGPLWAGFCALVNQQAELSGKPHAGFLNPALYTIGQGSNYSSCFHDITQGDNFDAANPSRYKATKGYDLCTGWGTPKGQALINELVNFGYQSSSNPAAGASDNTAAIVNVNPDGRVLYDYFDLGQGGHGFRELPGSGQTTAAPAAALVGPNHNYLFVWIKGLNGQLQLNQGELGKTFTGWSSGNFSPAFAPAATSSGNTSAIVTVDASNHIFYDYFDLGQGGHGFQQLAGGGQSAAAPAAALVGPNHNYLFVWIKGLNGQLQVNQGQLGKPFTGWAPGNFSTSFAPAAASSGNTAAIVAVDAKGHIFYDYFDLGQGGHGFQELPGGGQTAAAPAAALVGPKHNYLLVWIKGLNGQLQVNQGELGKAFTGWR
jgi:hypothetical protein